MTIKGMEYIITWIADDGECGQIFVSRLDSAKAKAEVLAGKSNIINVQIIKNRSQKQCH